MTHFDALKMYSCAKHCEKRKNCLVQAISPFFTMFSTLYGTYFSFEIHFKMYSAICFNLDQSKILSSGKGLKVAIMMKIVINSLPTDKILDWSKLKTLVDDKKNMTENLKPLF